MLAVITRLIALYFYSVLVLYRVVHCDALLFFDNTERDNEVKK